VSEDRALSRAPINRDLRRPLAAEIAELIREALYLFAVAAAPPLKQARALHKSLMMIVHGFSLRLTCAGKHPEQCRAPPLLERALP
jgi:hypothetical protein